MRASGPAVPRQAPPPPARPRGRVTRPTRRPARTAQAVGALAPPRVPPPPTALAAASGPAARHAAWSTPVAVLCGRLAPPCRTGGPRRRTPTLRAHAGPLSHPADADDEAGPSADLVDLVTAQLDLLPTLLAGAAAARGAPPRPPSAVRSTVYVRTAASLASGALHLRRLASGGEGGAGDGPAGGVLSLDGADSAAEDYLTRHAVVPLPDGGGLVLPLAHGRFLVGLLVVELDGGEGGAGSGGVHGFGGDVGAAGVRGAGLGTSPSAAPPASSLPATDGAALAACARVLAAAAALDARAALDAADGAARRRAASALVDAARAPLAALRTFGAMLLPRTREGDPGRDMAAGIVTQGDRLSEVVAALDAALHPPPLRARRPAAALGGGEGGSGEEGGGGWEGGEVGREGGGGGWGDGLTPPPPSLPAPTATPVALPAPLPPARRPRPHPDVEAGPSCSAPGVLAVAVGGARGVADALGISLVLKVEGGRVEGGRAAAGAAPAASPDAAPAQAAAPAPTLFPRPARPLTAGVPPATLRRAAGDVIDSALQRCARGGRVEVTLARAPDGGVTVDVTDNGAGMAVALEEHLRGARARVAAGGGGRAGALATTIGAGEAVAASLSGTTATAERPPAAAPQPSAAAPGPPASASEVMARLAAGLPGGSGAVALATATRVAAAAGARVSVLSAPDGGGTRVRLWLPPGDGR